VASIQERRTTSNEVSWRVQYRVDGRARSDTVATLTEAIRHKAAVERLGGEAARAILYAREGVSTADQVVTVASYTTTYVAGIRGITEGTRRDYASMVRRRIDGTPLGETPVEVVTRDAVVAWLDALPGSAKTKRNHHALLSAALDHAATAGLRAGNPAKGIEIAREVTRTGEFLTPGEVAIIASAIDAHYLPLFAFLVGTGARWGEATALLVSDVDLEARVPVARVTKAWKRTGTRAWSLGPPKSAAGQRTIALPPEVAEQLRPLVDGQPSSALLFRAPRGGQIRHDRFFSRVWKPTLDRLNATEDDNGNPITPALTKRPRIHDLRHTHASQLMAAGVPLNVVQKRLGHEKITTTADTYGHLAPDYLEVAAAAASLGLTQAFPAIEA
jgi:integrase